MENYEQKYKDSLERARIWKEKSGMPIDKQGILDDIFPELKKSEGEESKKWILEYLYDGLRKADKQFEGQFKAAIAYLEKLEDIDKRLEVQYKRGYDDGYLEGIVNAKKEFEKSKPTVIDIDKMVSKYANTKESTTNGLPVNCQIRAYRKGINDALNLLLDIEKPITIGKRRAVSGKLKELFDNKDPKSIEETKKKMLEETEPKFKVGDWLINRTNATIAQIVAVTDSFYDYREQSGQRSMSYQEYVEWDFRLWSITDAKDGDVLAGKIDGDDYILIFKQIKDGWIETYGHYYDAVDRFCAPSQLFCRDYKGTLHPAAKEQRDILFKKMHEAGYEWDAEKKETKLLISNGGDFEPELSHKEVTKKSDKVWNEDDEKNLQGVIDEIQANKSSAPEYDLKTYDKFLSWLKSIKNRVQPHPKWNEEDEEMKDLIDGISCHNDDVDYETHVRITRWLNELKQRLS